MTTKIILLSFIFFYFNSFGLTEEQVNYALNVKPILKEHCTSCHNPDKTKAGLDLSTYEALMKGSSGGEVVKPGLVDSSWLVEVIMHVEGVEPMPPKEPMIPQKQIETIKTWVAQGLINEPNDKSLLRKVEFNVATVTSIKPEGEAAMPTELEKVDLNPSKYVTELTAIAASPWAPLIATSGKEQVILKHAETREQLGVLPFPEGKVHVLKFSRNGSVLLAAGGLGGYSGKAILFDVKTGKRIAELGDEEDVVLAADISADQRFVALGGPSKSIKVYNTQSGKLIHRIKKHTDWITSISFAPEGDLFASADRNGGVHSWEAEKGVIYLSLLEHKKRVSSLAWRADGKMLASASEDGRIIMWDMSDGWVSKLIKAHESKDQNRVLKHKTGVLALDWGRDGTLVSIGRDKKLRYWNVQGNPLNRPKEGMDFLPISVCLTTLDNKVFMGGLMGDLINDTLKK